MSKRKKFTARRRRRRVSGIGGNLTGIIMQVAGVAAGAFVGNALTKMMANDDGTSKIDGKLLAAGKIGLGVFLVPKFVPGALGTALGNGLLAVGSIELLQNFKVIKGIGDADIDYAISGSDEMHIISGDGSQQLISGNDEGDGINPLSSLAIAGSM